MAESLPVDEEADSADQGPLWLEGRCVELGVSASWRPFIDLFQDYFGWEQSHDDRTKSNDLINAFEAFVDDGHLDEERLDDIGPIFGHLLSMKYGTDWDDRLRFADGQQIRHQTYMAVKDILLALAKRLPLIVILEDLHWADSLSLGLAQLLLDLLDDAPILLVYVYRPEREHGCWRLGTTAQQKIPERYTEISLRELTQDESRAMIASLLHIEELPESLREQILDRSQGNPFFVEEMVRSLIDSGMVFQDGDRWRARQEIETVSVPDSVQAVVLSRVDRLSEETRQLLQHASVVGRIFRRRVLEQVAEAAGDIDAALSELESHSLVYQERLLPEEEYAFRHALAHEAVYDTVIERRRKDFHLEAGKAIEELYASDLEEHVEALAYHYERSDDDEKAIEWLIKAGMKARKASLTTAATEILQRTLARLDRSDPNDANDHYRLSALSELGKNYLGAGEVREAEACFRSAIAYAERLNLPPRQMVRLYFHLRQAVFWRSGWDEIRDIAERGLALLGDDTESAETALMYGSMNVAHRFVGCEEEADAYVRRIEQFLDRLPYFEELRVCYTHVILLCRDERRDVDARKWISLLKIHGNAHYDMEALVEAQFYEANLELYSGNTRLAEQLLYETLDLCVRIGNTKHESWVLLDLSLPAYRRGDIDTAEDYLRSALPLLNRMDMKRDAALAHGYQAMLHRNRGDYEEAIRSIQYAIELDEKVGPYNATNYRQYLGRIYLSLGKQNEARAEFERTMPSIVSLSGLEELSDDPAAFREFCDAYQNSCSAEALPGLTQWYLVPHPTHDGDRRAVIETFGADEEMRADNWIWLDEFGDCGFDFKNGLVIHAVHRRDLTGFNLSAPRLLRSVRGNITVQTVCRPASDDRPGIGGILIWFDGKNFIKLDRGVRGPNEISLSGRINDQDVTVGRGRLVADRTYLRIERCGSRLTGFCSVDVDEWFRVGEVEFDVGDPIQIGLHAIGRINVACYPNSYPEGTAILFEEFELWEN